MVELKDGHIIDLKWSSHLRSYLIRISLLAGGIQIKFNKQTEGNDEIGTFIFSFKFEERIL